MSYGFLKDVYALEDTYRVDDLFDFSGELEGLKQRVNSTERSIIMGLLGDYGAGKSTLVYQLEKEYEQDKKVRFIHIDLWRFPERTNLWKNFLYLMTLDYGSERALEKVRRETEAKKPQAFANSSGGVSLGLQVQVEYGITDVHIEQDALYEIQNKVIDSIISKSQNLVIVIEDVDRSRENGAYFLETLKIFIQDNQEKLKKTTIKVIVPMSGDEFYEGEFKDSYQKSIDITYHFAGIPDSYSQFIRENFSKDIISEDDPEILSYLLHRFSTKTKTSIRVLKRILNEANERYMSALSVLNTDEMPDWRIFIMSELMRLDDHYMSPNQSLFNRAIDQRKIDKGTIYGSFLEVLLRSHTSMIVDGKLIQPDQDFTIVDTREKDLHENSYQPFRTGISYSGARETDNKISQIYFREY